MRRVWEWKEEYGGQIIGQLKRLGCTLDYERERFTMDEGYVQAVLRVFVDLYEKGYVYRDRYLVNWDPGLGSAISDLEVEDREVTDTMVSIAYPLSDGSGEVVVATVRPETMLGDTAVAVSPGDGRYRHLIGRTAVLPSSAASCRSSPTSTSIPSSAPAPSRSRPPTTPTTSRSRAATTCPRSA